MTGVVRGTGVSQHVTGERVQRAGDRLEEAVRLAELGGDHVWIAIVTHLIADASSIGPEMALDVESLVSADIGCYRCEKPYDERLLRRRCSGTRT